LTNQFSSHSIVDWSISYGLRFTISIIDEIYPGFRKFRAFVYSSYHLTVTRCAHMHFFYGIQQ